MKGTPRQKRYILVVEPDDLLRALLERWLGEAGYMVTVQERGGAAGEETPALVVANVEDPRRSDAAIRALRTTHCAPVLATSARFQRGLDGSAEVARRLGVCDVLPKPFSREELLRAVRECLREAD